MGADLTGHTLRAGGRREVQTQKITMADVPETTPEQRRAARLALACTALRFPEDGRSAALRDALEALGLIAPPPEPLNTPEPAPEPPAPAEAPETLDPESTVWLLPSRRAVFAHWPSFCPLRPHQTACGADTRDKATPTPADRVSTDTRCTSPACATRWRRWAADQPLRFRCPRCRVFHTPNDSSHANQQENR